MHLDGVPGFRVVLSRSNMSSTKWSRDWSLACACRSEVLIPLIVDRVPRASSSLEYPREGKGSKKDDFEFVIRPTFDAVGRELISFVTATLREICKQDVEGPTTADETMLLPWLRR